MDWSKTKTIFIIVFSIMNVFLYSLYLDRYTEYEKVEVLGSDSSSIEEKLKEDNISYGNLPMKVDPEPYVNAQIHMFKNSEIPYGNQQGRLEKNNLLHVNFRKPMPLEGEVSKETLSAFVEENVYQGQEYVFWKINSKENKAIFFQKVNGKTLYYSDNGRVTIYWNKAGQVTGFEQTVYEKVELGEQPKDLISPIQAIYTLYTRGVLPANSTIDTAEVGYSVYVQVSENARMFLPTWRISATLADGTKEEYFINAVNNGIVELETEEEEEVVK
ncbi:regulatory protein YycI of two-component signal transduction system YycFG [Planomicrobium soli]|uniref:Regulatory protein YycI of two-component signal transduction system YycFG n=1 Tax=Planomicrobium soli TaxID=1176648 RepID=A0A2P8H1C7_9BACL|nr:two-component system regulatory protein YycI [Planomicrobium soli]PSL40023.1 regulatory protein YycI of two-component signal transduction system YycFG [Planomicrobium soli]